jgi:hypothetical protein
MPSARDITFIGCRLLLRRPWRQLARTASAASIGLICGTLFSRPALADMGPFVVVPVVGFGLWHILLGAITVRRKSMAGHRTVALSIYIASVVCAWAINLFLPADSLRDFWAVLVLPLATSVGLIFFFRSADGS